MIKNLSLVALGLLLAACGNDIPRQNVQTVIAGSWTGTVTSSQNSTTGSMSMTLSQTGEDVTGSISTPGSPVIGGIVAGTMPLGQNGFDLQVTDTQGNLVGQFTGAVINNAAASGTFNMWDAAGVALDTGTFTLAPVLSTARIASSPGVEVLVIDTDTGATVPGTLEETR